MNPATFEQFSQVLETHGIAQALAYLNAGVPHRYTGLYRHSGGTMTNVELVDKHGEHRPEFLAEVPFEDSFCQFVLRDGFFNTANSAEETTLDGHKYKGVLLAYTGVPLDDGSGGLWGTLCHFDAQSWELPDTDFVLMKGAAGLLAKQLPAT